MKSCFFLNECMLCSRYDFILKVTRKGYKVSAVASHSHHEVPILLVEPRRPDSSFMFDSGRNHVFAVGSNRRFGGPHCQWSRLSQTIRRFLIQLPLVVLIDLQGLPILDSRPRVAGRLSPTDNSHCRLGRIGCTHQSA